MDGVLEDEAFPAKSFQLDVEAGCCLIFDAFEDDAWLVDSFQAVGWVLTSDMGRTVEGKLPGRLPDQAEPLILVLPGLWRLDGRLLGGSARVAFVSLPLTMLDCCCLPLARRCGGLL